MPRVCIHWFRRDLRLTDNSALHHAVRSSDQVIPVYILSNWQQHHQWTGPARQQFLCGCLESLAGNLAAAGSKLVLRQGCADAELEKLIRETGATAVFTNRDPDPFGRAMEQKVAAICTRLGVEFKSFKDAVLHEAGEVLTGEGKPYRVYTPYSRNWLSLPKAAPSPRVKSFGAAATVSSLQLPTLKTWSLNPGASQLPDPGERAARDRMKQFTSSAILGKYSQHRNLPAGRTTSQLSQDLRFGLISIRELYARCMAAGNDASILTYIKELAWREFYMAVLHHWPEVLEHEFNADFRNVPWPGEDTAFEAWKQGRTGFPIVDAGIRQLLATGLMHNRVRMITAMFLTKDLHVHWRLGESFFMQHLVDGEIASNNGGWQWSAGTGADAAPYFRIQNPWTQTKSYDPEGAYIKHWLPELAHVPAAHLTAPPLRPLSPDYPLPIVDHSIERDRTLERFKHARIKQ
ncbi:MAG: DNA photolyase family protein [Verrucomicrobia bacterium]|nr:DNA photolyase family protein [Verrucomicrobiota bacterium]